VLDIQRLASPLHPLLKQFYRSHGSRARIAPLAECWVVRQGEIVAGLCLTPVAEGYWLTNLLVAPEHRGTGVASALLTQVQMQTAAPIWLFCRPSLVGFYEQRGFGATEELPRELCARLERYRQTKALVAMRRKEKEMDTPTIDIVAAALFDAEGRLLVVRKRGSRFFMLPGGKREAGETSLQTLCRELKEELGLALPAEDVEPLGRFQAAAANEPGHRVNAKVFLGKLHEAVETRAEIEEACWLELPAVTRIELAPLLAEQILPALAVRR